MEQIKLWNYKYDQLNLIIEEFEIFNKNEWIELTIKEYLENQGTFNGIRDYLKIKQDKLLVLDDKKDAYIHNILLKESYEEYRVDKFSEEFILRLKSFNQEYNNSFRENDLFKSQYCMDHQIPLYEILFKEGYKLKTNNIHRKFQTIQDKLLENLQLYQKLYIQSMAISLKHSRDNSDIQLGQQYIKEAINLNPEQSRYYLIQSKLFNLNDQPENALDFLKQIKQNCSEWECLHEQGISYTKKKNVHNCFSSF